jgi:hypothetical protein
MGDHLRGIINRRDIINALMRTRTKLAKLEWRTSIHAGYHRTQRSPNIYEKNRGNHSAVPAG